MDIFEDLLTNTTGFPPAVVQDLRNTADTLQAMASFATVNVVAETQFVMDHLPELRTQRATEADLEAGQAKNKAERERLQADAQRLRTSAEKLKAPDAAEAFKRRAALVELSIYLKAKLRETTQLTPELDPERLKKFNMAMGAIVQSLPAEIGSRYDREVMARLAFVQELRDAGGNTDQAVDNFYKRAYEDSERGHLGDASLDLVISAADRDADTRAEVLPKEQQTQDFESRAIREEDAIEHAAEVSKNEIIQKMPMLAAEYLKPNEYAAYRVMIDNEHLLDWKIDGQGKVHFKAKTLDANDPENTVGKILMRDLDYQNIRGANGLIQTTVEKLNKLALENVGKEVLLTEKGTERMGKSTAEIVADPAAKAGPAPTAGKPRGKGKGI
jgi:hypothetical protein